MGIGHGECAVGAAELTSTASTRSVSNPRPRAEMPQCGPPDCDFSEGTPMARFVGSLVVLEPLRRSGMTFKQRDRGGSAFVKASPRMCTAVGAYDLAGVPYCIACTPGGSQDTCRSPGVLGGSARCRRGDHMTCPVHAGAAPLRSRDARLWHIPATLTHPACSVSIRHAPGGRWCCESRARPSTACYGRSASARADWHA